MNGPLAGGMAGADANDDHGLPNRYEAKESMAVKLLLEIANDTAVKHGLLFVRIVHSVSVPPQAPQGAHHLLEHSLVPGE